MRETFEANRQGRVASHGSRITFHESRFTITVHESRFTNHGSRITVHASRITNHSAASQSCSCRSQSKADAALLLSFNTHPYGGHDGTSNSRKLFGPLSEEGVRTPGDD